MILSHAALLALAAECVSPKAGPLIVALVEHENRCDCANTEAHGVNPNGTEDWGLGQINTSNFGMLSRYFGRKIDAQTILDPCTNLAASEVVLLARYNGSQALPIGAAYASGVMAKLNGETRFTAPVTAKSPPSAPPVPRDKPKPAPIFLRPGAAHELAFRNPQ